MRKLAAAGVVLALLGACPSAVRASDGRPPPGTVIMRIVIPRLHVDMPVVEGEPPGNQDGYYPTHYRSTNWPSEGETVAISAHHYTHALPGASGGPFRYLDQLRSGDHIYLIMAPRFGHGAYRYRVTGQRWFYCGSDAWYCPSALQGFTKLWQDKLILTTCIGNGHIRRILYAYIDRA